MPLEVEVISQVRQLYHTETADMVIVPGSEGELGVLPNHAPLLTTLDFGEVRIIEGDNITSFVVYGGILEVRPNKVTLLADDAQAVYEIDVDAVEEARERARQLMAESPSAEQRAHIAQELRRAEIAVRVRHRVDSRPGQQIRTLEDT